MMTREEQSNVNSTGSIRDSLQFQLGISWQLLQMHLAGLEDEEYFWRPADRGLHIHNESGTWRADWPESEEYDIGPPSIAWLTWHITFWWSMAYNYTFGDGTLAREQIGCPKSAEEAKETISRLHDEWTKAAAKLSEDELLSSERTKWPFAERPFHEFAAWLNLELMKNAAEIGYCRFLYASRKQ